MKVKAWLTDGEYPSAYVVGGAWAILFLAVIVAYWPGLSGPFVLDDFGSVAALGDRGGVIDWATFKAFVFGGHGGGPTGRPLSMATFLLDANNWPAEACSFKRTNLAIHCLCGVLLGLLIHQILQLLRLEIRDIQLITIASVGVWMLHPFLVSTTLYVVQRMAQLSTMFSLAGLVLYVRGRMLVPEHARRGYLLMTFSIVVFGVLAALSKENGVLLPLFAGVFEVTIVASQRDRFGSLNRYWLGVFFLLPAIVIFAYLGAQGFRENFFAIVPPRDFSLYERALTQPRVLFDYLQNWFVPKLYTTGVFQDHILKSTGILSPISTIFALFAHLGVIGVVIAKRRQWPLPAFAVLFFYTAHLLDSTVINLELYFEHRNYLASSFLFLPLLVALQRWIGARLFILASVAVFLLLGNFTRYSATVWASYPSMVEASAHKAPTSARAQSQYSVMLYNAGRYAESLEILNRAIENIPAAGSGLRVNRLITLCNLNQLRPDYFDDEVQALAGNAYDARSIALYSTMADAIANGKCPDVTMPQLTVLFTNMLQQSHSADSSSLEYSQIQYLIGFSYAHSGQREKAVSAFQASLNARSGAGHAMQMAAVLASMEFAQDALDFSEQALAQLEEQSSSLLHAAPVSQSDIRAFQATVRADMEAGQDVDNSGQEQ